MNTPLSSTVGNLTLVNAKPCTVDALHAINGAAAVTYVQVFDAAAVTDVTLGTTVPRYVLPLAASSAAEGLVGGSAVFHNGIVVASTTAAIGTTTAASHFRCWVS